MTEKVITQDKLWAKIKNQMDLVYGHGSGNQRVHGLTYMKIKETGTGYRFVPVDEVWRRFHSHKMPDIKSTAFSELFALVERYSEMMRKQDELVKDLYDFAKVFRGGKFEEDDDETPARLDDVDEFINEMRAWRKKIEDDLDEIKNPKYDDDAQPAIPRKSSSDNNSEKSEDEDKKGNVEYGEVPI